MLIFFSWRGDYIVVRTLLLTSYNFCGLRYSAYGKSCILDFINDLKIHDLLNRINLMGHDLFAK